MNPQHFLAWGSPLAAVLPREWAENLADIGGRIAGALAASAKTQVRRNLEEVLGRPVTASVVESVFSSYARYYLGMMRLAHRDLEDAVGRVELQGESHLEHSLAAGRGALLLTAHFGSWDVAGAAIAQRFGGVHAFVEVLPPRVHSFYSKIRQKHGVRPIAASSPGRTPIRIFRDNEILALVADRLFGRRSCRVSCGESALNVPTGGIRLALRMGAGIHSFFAWRRKDGFLVKLGRDLRAASRPTVSLEQQIQQVASSYAEEVAACVRSFPEQWCLLHPLQSNATVRMPVGSAT